MYKGVSYEGSTMNLAKLKCESSVSFLYIWYLVGLIFSEGMIVFDEKEIYFIPLNIKLKRMTCMFKQKH